ncbi:hypothetical protein Bca4012_075320 [Brassica carinata]
MQAFETFITAAKSGGGEDMNGGMAELALMQNQTTSLVPSFPASASQPNQPAQTRVALSFLLSEKGNFFREFLLDEIVKGWCKQWRSLDSETHNQSSVWYQH